MCLLKKLNKSGLRLHIFLTFFGFWRAETREHGSSCSCVYVHSGHHWQNNYKVVVADDATHFNVSKLKIKNRYEKVITVGLKKSPRDFESYIRKANKTNKQQQQLKILTTNMYTNCNEMFFSLYLYEHNNNNLPDRRSCYDLLAFRLHELL